MLKNVSTVKHYRYALVTKLSQILKMYQELAAYSKKLLRLKMHFHIAPIRCQLAIKQFSTLNYLENLSVMINDKQIPNNNIEYNMLLK